MTTEGFRRMAAPIASEVARKRGVSEELVEAVMEQMAEEGRLAACRIIESTDLAISRSIIV
jgi:hypothetical protein